MGNFTQERTGQTGTREWSEISYNIHNTKKPGCLHGCIYCYARYNALKRFKSITTLKDWLNPEIDWKKVRKKWQKREGVIMFPTQHDITSQNVSAATETIINILQGQNKVLIVSKPCVAAMDVILRNHDMRTYRKTNQLLFRFTIGTFEEHILRTFEPHAPTAAERLECLQYAHREGFQTSVSAEPLLGGAWAAERIFQAVLPYITETLWFGFLNRPNQRILDQGTAFLKSYIQSVTNVETANYCAALAEKSGKVKLKDSMQKCLKNKH